MKKFFIIVFLLLAITSVSIAQEIESDAKERAEALINKMDSCSVSIFSIGDSGVGLCSGVLIKNDEDLAYIVTAKHCVGTYEEVYVENVKVYHIEVSINEDLALLVTNKKIEGKVPTVFAERDSKWGEVMIDLGYPKIDMYIAVGTTWVRSFDHQYARLKVIPGCSGGGIFNIDGEFVGTVWGGIGEGIAILEPLSDVKIFLRSIGAIK